MLAFDTANPRARTHCGKAVFRIRDGWVDLVFVWHSLAYASYLGQKFEGDYQIEPQSVVSLPCKPGEFLLFTERLIHGSEHNRSQQPCMSFVFRYIKPDTAVFRGEKRHRVTSMRKTFPLDNWVCVLVHGRDTVG